MRSKAPGISPAKIAVATVVTMAAIAGTGSMKKVNGINSAVAMVAVRPGMAPTNRPKTAAINITPSVWGSAIRANDMRSVSTADYHATGNRMPQGRGTSSTLANSVWMMSVVAMATTRLVSQLDPNRTRSVVKMRSEVGINPNASEIRM